MRRYRLVWRLFVGFVLLIVLCSGATGAYAWRTFRRAYEAQTARMLEATAEMVREQVALPISPASQPDLERLCRRMGRASDTRVTIISASGQVLADNRHDAETMANHADRPEVKEALAGRIGQAVRHSYTLDDELMYVAAPIQGQGGVVGVVRTSMPLARLEHALVDIHVQIGAAAAVVMLIAGLLALLLSRMLSRPLEAIRAGAERFARGELKHRLYVPDTAEAAAVAESLNEMAARLDETIAAISEQRARQEAMLASMIEGVVAVDRGQNVISANQAAARLMGGQGGQLVGRTLREAVRNVELEGVVEGVLAGGEAAESELVLRREQDSRTVQVHATPLRDAGGAGIGALLVFNDVTTLRRLERIRQDFVANVSHELKTPITSIKGFVETLRDGAAADPERATRFLEIVSNQADRLNAIIEDLLSLSRIEQEAERQEIKLEPTPLCETLAAAIQLCQLKAEARNINVELACPAGLSARANGALLEQAVSNLVDNAIKYSEPGGSVRVTAGRADGGVEIRVGDRGSGIAREHLPRLFERFYRVDKSRSRTMGGTGLGLAIVKHIVAAHGGEVSVASELGQGSTFTIRLPD